MPCRPRNWRSGQQDGASEKYLVLEAVEPWQNLIGLLGHLSREVLDGQFFALIVRLVGNAMVQLIRDEQVVRFVRQRCSHVTPRRASLNEEASAETGRRETARQSTHRNLRHSLEDLVIDTLERAG